MPPIPNLDGWHGRPRVWVLMADLAQSQTRSDAQDVRRQNAHVHRHRPLYVLFVHRNRGAIDSCLHELKKEQFTVRSEFVLNPAQCATQLRSRSFDVIVVEYPSPACLRRTNYDSSGKPCGKHPWFS